MMRAIFFLFIALIACGPSLAQAQDVVPFRLARGYLVLVPCSVGGRPNLTAVIDTGTTETVLSRDLVRQLALPTQPDSATALDADSPALAVSIPDLHLGSLHFKQLDGIALDLSPIAAQLGVRPDVIIGMDVLHRQNLTIDYAAHLLRFGAALPLRHTASFRPSERFLLLDSTVLAQPVTLKLDTGFNGVLLYANRVTRLVGLVAAQGAVSGVAGVADAAETRTVQITDARMGNWRSAHLTVALLSKGPTAANFYDGLLGPAALHMQRLSCDFERHLLSWD